MGFNRCKLSHDASISQKPPNLLVQYFTEAFEFTDGEAYPIFGWHSDGAGELNDDAIDRLMTKRILQAKIAVQSDL